MKDGETDEVENQSAHLASMLKIAVATAIVKTKPRHLTAEDYARDLCSKFAVSQLSWRSKYESVETELLRAKQELALREIHTQSTQDSPSDAPTVFLTPPPSLEETPSSEQEPNGPQKDLELHTKFLQGVAQLKSLPLVTAGGSEISHIMKATIFKSVKTIQDAIYQSNKTISYKCLAHAISTVAKVCSWLPDSTWADVRDCVEDLLNVILKELCLQDSINKYTAHEQLTDMFLCLASQVRLQKKGMDILLSQIEDFSGHLKNVSEDKGDLDPVVFENMFYVLKATEVLLSKAKITNSNFKDSHYQRLSDRLDDAFLYFTDQFPLFGQLLWKIGLNHMSQSERKQIM
ncbi:meiosis-specific protein MEI4-like isoform X2 [Liolophura sinensis]|uniref:meiosis-specific protein MEI4-like isoform X2 n=1 Tax=Liolophura sinensis TaxID=3198878 RepID=UPI0031593AFA